MYETLHEPVVRLCLSRPPVTTSRCGPMLWKQSDCKCLSLSTSQILQTGRKGRAASLCVFAANRLIISGINFTLLQAKPAAAACMCRFFSFLFFFFLTRASLHMWVILCGSHQISWSSGEYQSEVFSPEIGRHHCPCLPQLGARAALAARAEHKPLGPR